MAPHAAPSPCCSHESHLAVPYRTVFLCCDIHTTTTTTTILPPRLHACSIMAPQ